MKKIVRLIVSYYRQTDRVLWILCLLLSACSILLISGILESGYAGYLKIGRRTILVQSVATFLGAICAIIISKIDYHTLTGAWKLHAGATYFLTLLTFAIGVGAAERPEAKRWLLVPGIDFMLQPSEILKISFILVFAYHIHLVYDDINRPLILLGLLAHGSAPVLLMHFQGDDGNALITLVIIICMLFCAGLSWKYIISVAAVAAVSMPLVWQFVLNGFQKMRILALFNQSESDAQGYYFQQHWAKIAFAFGGAGGKGIFGASHTYVPEMHNDFIFSFLGESLGFVGCFLTLAVIFVMWIKILVSANKALDIQGKLVCTGVFAMLSFQSLINIGMNISLLPVIGNTLPFLSYGGSSTLTSYMALGLVLSVYMHSAKSIFD